MLSLFPPEVCLLVIESSDRSDLVNIALTCRSFLPLARRQLYHDVVLSPCENCREATDQLEGTIACSKLHPTYLRLQQNPLLRQYARRLNVYGVDNGDDFWTQRGGENSIGFAIVKYTIDLFPNLTDISFDDLVGGMARFVARLQASKRSIGFSRPLKIHVKTKTRYFGPNEPLGFAVTSLSYRAAFNPRIILHASRHTLRSLAIPYSKDLELDHFPSITELQLLCGGGAGIVVSDLAKTIFDRKALEYLSLAIPFTRSNIQELIEAVEGGSVFPPSLRRLGLDYDCRFTPHDAIALVKLPSDLPLRKIMVHFTPTQDPSQQAEEEEFAKICVQRGIIVQTNRTGFIKEIDL